MTIEAEVGDGVEPASAKFEATFDSSEDCFLTSIVVGFGCTNVGGLASLSALGEQKNGFVTESLSSYSS